MQVTKLVVMIVVVGGLATGLNADPAPTPPAAPNTLWRFLGIPQGVNKIKDATRNKSGNRPNRERKPPLKRIADPENLESQNPAIKAAAKIKAEEDLAPQKVKAIKYLATVGCGCYPGVREALLAALDDCTEEVRYQAAIAFCQAAGSPCKNCERGGCCSAAVMSKLEDVAHGQDEKGCFKESSPRVRAAAENALNACRQKLRPSAAPAVPEPAPPKKELPTPARPELPQPPSAPETPPAPAPVRNGSASLQPDAGQPSGGAAAQVQMSAWNDVQPVSLTGSAEARDEASAPQKPADAAPTAQYSPSGWRRRCPGGRETVICPEERPGAVEEGKAPPTEAAPLTEAAPAPGAEAAPPANALAGNYGAATGAASASPNMIGDFFGGGARFFGAGPLGGSNGPNNASVGIAGGDRRFKIDENESPILADRVFFDYNHFQNALQDVNNQLRNLDVYTFGVEKTFRDGLWSVELRAPVTSNYNSTQTFEGSASLADTEFADLAVAIKRLIVRRDGFMLSTGLGVAFPTGKNWTITDSDGLVLVEEKNESVHLQPFLGAVWEPNDRWFFIAFAQIDFDTHGNRVLMRDSDSSSDPLVSQGVFQEQNLAFADLTAGYWLFRDRSSGFITGMAPVIELHYAATLQNEDLVTGPMGSIGASDPNQGPVGPGQRNVLNLTGGLHFQIGPRSTLTVAGVAPLGSGVNRDYDSELAVQFNRRF